MKDKDETSRYKINSKFINIFKRYFEKNKLNIFFTFIIEK